MDTRGHKRSKASGFSLIELLIVIVILGILSQLSLLYITASRRAANGASAIQSLRVIHSTQTGYSAGVGNQNFAEPQELFNEDYIDAGLARACNPLVAGVSKSGQPALPAEPKSGFNFLFTRSLAVPTDASRYTVLARPFVDTGIARTGDRTFFVDQTGVIRASTISTAAADTASNPLN